MPLPSHRIEIRKSYLGRSWSNDWLVNAANMDDAAGAATDIEAFERTVHAPVVRFDYRRVSTYQPLDRIFRHTASGVFGTFANMGIDFLPLFNTLRFDMTTEDSDPARKYFRCPLGEQMVTNEVIDIDLRQAANTGFTALLAALGGDVKIVTTRGNLVISGSAFLTVQMRQLHRHRRKKVEETP